MTTRELPAAVLERYSARQSVCFCGVLPEIGRAWATVDNALFLWRYDVPDDVPVEYAGEEQAIVAVAVATPRPGVFLQSIERLIVVATTTEIVLLGAAFETAGDEDEDAGVEPTRTATISGDGGAEIGAAVSESAARVALGEKDMTLHALDYACVTDDVIVKDFACTSTGRIFFAGDDEALYEVEYSAGDSWRSRRCRKTCHHSATPKLLPSILRLRAPDALRQVLVDEDRCALYTRSENGVVAVYDLGAALAEAPRRVAEVRDVAAAAQTARGGGLFYDGRGAGGGFGGGAHGYAPYGGAAGGGGKSGAGGSNSQTQKGKRLVHVAVVSARESATVTLVAVCADGRRVYFTALPSAGYGRYGQSAPFGSGSYGGADVGLGPHRGTGARATQRASPAVTRLAVLAVRDPPPQASAARGMTAAQSLRATTTARPLEVEAAYYAEGVMLLSDAAEADEDARLFFASRDASLPSHLRAVSPAERDAAAPPYGAGADPFAGAEGAGYGGGVSGGGGGAAAHAARSLREAVSTRRLTGRAASSVGSIGEVPPPPAVLRDLDPPLPAAAAAAARGPGAAGGFKPPAPSLRGGELATQHVAPRRRFVLVTNAGVVLVEKARPVDALRELLLDDVHEHIARFFAAYGQAEAATMCLALALGACAEPLAGVGRGDDFSDGRVVGAGAEASGAFFSTRASSASAVAAAAERARLALEDPRLTGEPRVDEDRSDPNRGAGALSPGAAATTAANGANGAPFDMGRAIVQPRVHFSGVHAAAFTYAARVLAAVWERPVAVALAGGTKSRGALADTGAPREDGVAARVVSRGASLSGAASSPRQPLREAVANGAAANGAVGAASAAAGWLGGVLGVPSRAAGAPAACAVPADALASLERRLRRLERFLARRRRFGDAGAFAHAPAGDPKRRRVDPSAARRAEERSLAALRGALRRAAEASALLRVASESGNFARAAARLSREDREALTRGDFTLRRLATTSEGARLASALVEALMSALVSAGDVEAAELAARHLQTLCPLFFGGDERRFYRARQALQAARDARDARDAADAERRTAEALAALLEVPAAGNLSATMAELADAGCFHGLVALPLCAAAAARRRRPRGGGDGFAADDAALADAGLFAAAGAEADPFDEADRSAAAAMTADTPEACREYVCVALRALATGAPDEGAPPGSLGAVCAGLAPEARARGLATMLSRAAQASSPPAAAAARARLVAAKAEAEAAAAAAARAGAPFVPPPEVSCAARLATATASAAEAEGAALDDGAFARRVYAELVALREDDALLAMPPGPLERFLAEKGAFAVAQQGGALTQQQARHLELLAKLYGAKGRDALAARVYYALAERDAAGAAVPLAERAALLDLAMRKASGAGAYARGGDASGPDPDRSRADVLGKDDVDGTSHASFLETLEGKIEVLGFQTRLRGAFLERARAAQTSDAATAARAAAEDLERELRPLSDMFNDFARPAEMWGLCLEMLHFSRYRDRDDDGAVARELWDAALGDAAADAVADGDVAGAARAACAAAAALGPKLFPSDAAFPVAHVALRLELLNAGLWRPERGERGVEPERAPEPSLSRLGAAAGDDAELVAETVLRATRDSFEAAHAAYDRLLAAPHAVHRAHHDRGVQSHARHLQTPALRLRLLRSALRVLRRWEASLAERQAEPRGGFGAYGGGKRRARATLADVCAGYAGEARRLLQVPASEQGAAEALAAEFEALGKRLASA